MSANKDIAIRLSVDASGVKPAIDGASQSLGRLKGQADQAGTGAERLSQALGRVANYGLAGGGLYALASAAQHVGKAVFDASASAQRMATQLNFATDGKGAQEMAFVAGVAQRLGLQLTSTAQAYAGFAAAARGTALEGAGARAVFEGIAKASAVMGLSADQSSGALLAVQQMMSKGVVSAEEFRGQLGERMPIALQAGAQALGVTTAEFSRLLETGQIVAQDFLPKFSAAITEMLGNSVDDAAGRLDAAVNRMGNAWDRFKRSVGDSGVSQAIANEATGIGNYLTSISDAMDRAKASGSGMAMQLSTALGHVIARAPFDALAFSANTLNGTLNAVSLGALRLNTNVNLLPAALDTSARQSEALGRDLKAAESRLAELQARGAANTPNIYLKSAYADAYKYAEQLRAAKRAQDALRGQAVGGGRGTINPETVGDINARAAKEDAALAAARRKIYGVKDSYQAELSGLSDLYTRGKMPLDEYRAAVAQLAGENYKAEKSAAGAARGTGAQQNAYESFLSSVRQKIEAQNAEAASGAKLSEAERERIRLQGALSTTLQGLAPAQRAVIEAEIERLALAEQGAAATKAAIALAEQRQQAHIKEADSIAAYLQAQEQAAAQSLASVTSRVGAMRDEEEALRVSAKLNISLAEAVEQVAIARLKEKQDGFYEGSDGWERLQKEIDARKELAGLIAGKAQRDAAAESAKQAEAEWQKSADDINRSLTDALLRGFESGKGFAKNLRDTIENMFSTLVLRPVISAVMTPVSGAINGMLGAGGGGGGSGGVGGSLASLANMGSTANSVLGFVNGQGMLGGLGASIFGSTAAYAAAVPGLTSMAAGSQAAMLAAQTGVFGAAGTSATAAAGAGAAGAGAGGLSGAIASIPGWGWALAGIGALFGGDIINGLFGRKLKDSGVEGDFGGATGFEGRQFEYYKGGLFRSDKTKYKDLDEETRAALADTFNAMRSGAKEMAGVLGLGTEAIDGFTAHVKVSLKGLSAEEADKRLKEEFDKVAESLASTTLGTQDYTRAGETALQTLTRLSGSLTGVNQVFENLGATLYASSLAGADMASQLVDLFGGMDGLSQTAGSYMQNYYSADEQRAAVQRQLQKAFDGLNLKLPDINAADARAQFRALADAQDLTTEAGRKTYASLLQLSGAFAQVTQSAEDAAEAARQQASEQAQSAVDAAFANVKAAIEREQQYWKDIEQASRQAVSALTGTLGLLTNNARELYGTVDTTQQMLAAQGMVYIEDALAAVRGGASATGYDGLQDAIGAARGGIASGVYASDFERQRDALVLAGQLSELGDLTDKQLTTEQRALAAAEEQIKQLDATLEYWQQQIDGTGQLIDVGLSIEGAIGQLSAALAQREAVKSAGGGGGGAGRPGVDFNEGLQKQIAEAWNKGDWITAQNIIRGYGFSNDQLKEAFDLNYADLRYLYSHGYTNQNPGDYSFSAKTAEGVYAEARAQGLTLAEVDGLINAPAGTAEEWAKANGLPIFHQGTNYVPRTGFALLEQGEQVVPRVYNPFAGGQMPQGNNAELIAEVRALRAEVAALRAPMEQTAQSTTQHATQFDNVTAGGNAMATEVFVV